MNRTRRSLIGPASEADCSGYALRRLMHSMYPSGKLHLFMLARGLWPRGARRGRLALVCNFGGIALAFDGAFGENSFALYYR